MAAERLLPFAETLVQAAPAQQAAIVRHIVEKVVITDRQVVEIKPRLEAAPFVAAMTAGMAVAPPDGRRGARSKSLDPLAWYALV